MTDINDLFKKIETAPAGQSISWIICGLGNPGTEYLATRHNVGFCALDYVAQKYGAVVDRAKFHALTGECRIAGQRVLLMKPQTFMNNSGTAVGEAAGFYKIPASNVLIYSDDISIAPGRLRFRQKGSAGGHNGLKSIIAALGGDGFPRIRLGVGEKPTPDYDLADWVLGKLPLADRDALNARLDDLCRGTEALLNGDIDLTSRTCNSSVGGKG